MILRFIFFCLMLLLTKAASFAQQKATINNGPVDAVTKNGIKPTQRLGKTRLFEFETVFLNKGEWVISVARSRDRPISIDLYDRKIKKYIHVAEDTVMLKGSVYYVSELIFKVDRTDSFDLLYSVKNDPTEYKVNVANEDYFSSEDSMYVTIRKDKDTAQFDYMLARYNPIWQPVDTNWGFTQRLSYICNHWTAGFRGIPQKPNEEQLNAKKEITEYFPEVPISLDDKLYATIQMFGSTNKTANYFMYGEFDTYAKSKALYDNLFAKLKKATDGSRSSDLSKFSRIYELATSFFYLKIPKSKVPFEYGFFAGSPNPSYHYVPINLYLNGTKNRARVLVVIGEQFGDIYDVKQI